MSKRSVESRLTIVERKLKTAKGKLTEITIEGGFDGPGVAVRAQIIGGCYMRGRPVKIFFLFKAA